MSNHFTARHYVIAIFFSEEDNLHVLLLLVFDNHLSTTFYMYLLRYIGFVIYY